MKLENINIRDPFVLAENGTYYLYGTRAENFGCKTGGFDVYTSTDLVNFSEAKECFNSEKYELNKEVNWAPEVHKYKGEYYMLATFTQENGLRGSYILKSDSPLGEFKPYSDGALTPQEWECLDATLYISKAGEAYLVFCHEHTQIIDGTICFVKLNKDLNAPISLPTKLFSGSSPYWADNKPSGEHYITDGPFMYRTSKSKLLLIWSTFVNHKYCQCVARSSDNELSRSAKSPALTNGWKAAGFAERSSWRWSDAGRCRGFLRTLTRRPWRRCAGLRPDCGIRTGRSPATCPG